jgi:DNA-binding NtrC family response regulator
MAKERPSSVSKAKGVAKVQSHQATQTFQRETQLKVFALDDFRLVVVGGPSRDLEITLTKDTISIGSGADNDLVLADPTVSRRHCELQRFGDSFLLLDMKSTNGTLLDGTGIREAFVKPGSLIELGSSSIKVMSSSHKYTVEPSNKEEFGGLKGKSTRMREVYSILEKVSPSDATILIMGETGTGKELVARAIHQYSHRSKEAFVVFDCSAVSPNLIESELFGHVKGAYTGAINDRRGAFEAAHRGTIFLDEIGELGEELQPKLLRALEQKEIRRVGSEQFTRIDVRLIAATNRNLAEEVRAGRFREDLFFRLSVIPISMPALRQRREDIPVLIEHFLHELAEKRKDRTAVKSVGKKAMDLLAEHTWPGNVRELRNVIEGAVAMCDTDKLEPKDFIFFAGEDSGKRLAGMADSSLIGKSLEQIEKTVIESTLKAHSGNKMATAKTLGIAYSTLYEKLKKYGIDN